MTVQKLGLLSWLLVASAFADPVSQPHVQLELVSPDTSLQPGRPTQVGVHFEVESGWHLYWKNPGDSGKPPSIRWEMPPGFTAGSWEWPVPLRIPFGRLVNYGYDRRLLLASPLEVPAGEAKGEATLGAHVEWLVCAEECIPGKLDLRLRLPWKDATPEPSASAALFRASAETVPKPIPSGWKIEGWIDSETIQVAMSGFAILGETLFFPDEPRLIQNAAPQVLGRRGDALLLTMKRSEQSPSEIKKLTGVLVTGAKGYSVEIPLVPRPTTLPPWLGWAVGGLVAGGLSIWLFLKRPRRGRPTEGRAKRMAGYLGSAHNKST
jgi:DsbC/DsbD-like thiol-disulfide interchange protein